MADRRALAAAIAMTLAIPAEGLRQYAYRDPVGILTVCYGHTGKDVARDRLYSLDECRSLLTDDMRQAVADVDACVPGMPVEVLAAFSDAAFNVGPRIACDKSASTAARKLAAGDYAGACNELPKWNKATVGGVRVALPGLTTRREKERLVCLRGA